MIKREVRIFTRDDLFQDFLDTMEDGTSIAHYSVSNDGVHYIITERKMTDDEHKKFKIIELRNKITKCNVEYERRIKACEQAMHECHESLQFEVIGIYEQRRNELIEEYNDEQRKLTNKLDKLQKSL